MPHVSDAIPRSTGCWLLWLRADLPRDSARKYWRGRHAQYVAQVPGLHEYRQLHFSATDHGFWPAPAGTGSAIPQDWRVDGVAEVTYKYAWPQPRSLTAAIRLVFPDECNAFDRMIANLTGPRGGRWLISGNGAAVGARAVVLVRRRPGTSRLAFSAFVHDELGGALARTEGIIELRTHVFLPYSRWLWPTPGVAHDNPPHRRYHAAVVLGAADRHALDEIVGSPELRATHDGQAASCLALHAYAVEETVAVVSDGAPAFS